MIIQKLFVSLLVVGLIFQTASCAQTIISSGIENNDVPPVLKQKASQMLGSIVREAGQFKSAENRIRARIIAADLMWQQDEAAARSTYKEAFTELRNLFAQADAARDKKTDDGDQSAFRFRLRDLRREYVLTLAAHDGAAAIDALGLLKAKKLETFDPLAEDAPALKLKTAAVIAERDPNRADALYAEEIAAGGITLPLLESLRDLQARSSVVSVKVTGRIFEVIKSAKIGDLSENGNSKAASANPAKLEFWQVGAFLNAAAKLKRYASRDGKTPPLADEQLKQLAEILAREFLNTPNPAKNSINHAMTNITLYAPVEAKLIRQKVGAEGVKGIEIVMESDAFYLSLEEKNADNLAREAETTKDEMKRDLLYSEAARKALDAGDAEKAQTIAKRIKDRENYFSLVEEIEKQVPLAIARRGDEAKTRKILSGLKTDDERRMVLVELASAFAAKGDKVKAKKLLDETIDTLFAARPNAALDESDLESVMEFAGKFAAVSAVVDPDETFGNLEPIIYAVNAEVKRQNPAAVKELSYDSMERKFLLNISNSNELLRNLGRADFERTLKLIDKFERPEIRVFARLRLVQALLDQQADEKVQEKRERLLAEMDES